MNSSGRWWNTLRVVGWSLAVLFLLAPLVAMQYTDEVNWELGDFLFAAVLLGGSGLVFELIMRRSKHDTYRTGALLALFAMFLLVWSNAAVGFVGSGANTANVLYVAMLAVPVIGGIVSRLKARGMFMTLLVTATVQAAIMVFAFAAGLVTEDSNSMILAINTIFILLWMGSAVLFHQAAESDASTELGTRTSIRVLRVSPVQCVLSVLMMAIGAVMLTYMITAEDEPGLIPLLVFLLGTGWFIITLFRSKAAQSK